MGASYTLHMCCPLHLVVKLRGTFSSFDIYMYLIKLHRVFSHVRSSVTGWIRVGSPACCNKLIKDQVIGDTRVWGEHAFCWERLARRRKSKSMTGCHKWMCNLYNTKTPAPVTALNYLSYVIDFPDVCREYLIWLWSFLQNRCLLGHKTSQGCTAVAIFQEVRDCSEGTPFYSMCSHR